MAENDNIDINKLEDVISSFVDITSAFQTQAQNLITGLEDFGTSTDDIVSKISKNKTGMTLTLLRMKNEFSNSMDLARQELLEGKDVVVGDITKALGELAKTRQQMIAQGLPQTKLNDFDIQVRQLHHLQDFSDSLQSNIKAANVQAEIMARRFGTFIENIPYIGQSVSQALGLGSIRGELMESFETALRKALTDSSFTFGAMKDMGIASFRAIGQVASKMLANPMILLLALGALAVQRFLSLEKAAENFRREVGLSGAQTAKIEMMARDISVQYQNMGVGLEEVLKSAGAIVTEFGTLSAASEEVVRNTALASSALGISEQTSAGFVRNVAMISDLSLESASNFQMTVYELAKAGNVAPVKVIEDMANASENALISFGGYPEKLAAAAVQARQLGTTVSKISDATRGLLDFQSSISAEMQASTLLGRNLNLQRARQLRFAGEDQKAQQEILDVVSKIGNLDNLNIFQKEAIAKATGSSIPELQKQLRLRERLLRFDLDKADLDAKAIEALQSAGKLSQDMVNTIVRENDVRSEQAKMMAELRSLMSALSEVLIPIVRVVVGILTPAFKFIGALVRAFLKPFQEILGRLEDMGSSLGISSSAMELILKTATSLGTVVGRLLAFPIQFYVSLIPVWKIFGAIGNNLLGIIKSASLFGTTISGWFKNITSVGMGFAAAFKIFEEGPLLSFLAKSGRIGDFLFDAIQLTKGFGKALPVIGWVIFGVEALIRSVKGFIDIWSSTDNFGDKLVKSFKVIPMAIFDTFVSPFKMVLNWIGGFFDASDLGDRFFGVFKTAYKSVIDLFYSIPQLFIESIFTKGPEEAFLNFFKNIGALAVGLGDLIVSGIRAVGGDIAYSLLGPFYKVWDVLKETFLGQSPSKLGLGIVKGLQAVTGMISDILLAPFRFVENVAGRIMDAIFGKAQNDPTTELTNSLANLSEGKLSLIKEVASLLSSDLLSSNILKTAESIDGLSNSINKISTMDVMKLTVMQAGETVKQAVTKDTSQKPSTGPSKTTDDVVVSKLTELINLMKDGGIAVNLDGRKVSKGLVSKVY